MLPSWCNDSVTVERPHEYERRGTTELDWTYPDTHDEYGCSFQMQSTSRERPGRELQVADGAVLFAPFDADIKAGDRLIINGTRYEINGEPIPVRGATGNLSHLEIPLQSWKG